MTRYLIAAAAALLLGITQADAQVVSYVPGTGVMVSGGSVPGTLSFGSSGLNYSPYSYATGYGNLYSGYGTTYPGYGYSNYSSYYPTTGYSNYSGYYPSYGYSNYSGYYPSYGYSNYYGGRRGWRR